MSNPHMKLEARSPLSNLNEEEQSKEDERVFERRLPKAHNRPQSAKASENQNSRNPKRKSHRPISAKKGNMAMRSRLVSRKEADKTFLARLKPRHIPMDKERLYEENMALKVQNHNLHDEMLKVRTRANQLERELFKRDEVIEELRVTGDKFPSSNLKRMHLVGNLKQSVKELRSELKSRDEEIARLRKNIKSTKTSEMEVEIQAYIDECTRLRHHLEEVMRQREATQSSQGFTGLEEKHYQQTLLVNNLRKENQELSQALTEAREESSRWRERASELEKKKKPISKKGENNHLKAEIQKLKTQLDNSHKENSSVQQDFKKQIDQLKKDLNEANKKTTAAEQKLKEKQTEIERLKKEKPVAKQPEKPYQPPKEEVKKVPNPHKFFQKIHKAVQRKNMEISVFLSLLDKNINGLLKLEEFVSGMKHYGQKIKKKHVADAIKLMTGKESNMVPLRIVEEWYEKYDYSHLEESSASEDESPKRKPSPPKESPPKTKTPTKQPVKTYPKVTQQQIKSYLDHFSLRLQLHRISKSKVNSTVFGSGYDPEKTVNKADLMEFLSKEPLSFEVSKDLENFAVFLLQPETKTELTDEDMKNLSAKTKEICTRLSNSLEDWEVFTPEDEEDFDKELTNAIAKNKTTLKEACKIYDSQNSGTVTVSSFEAVLKDLEIQFSKKVLTYMKLLFYSHNFELDSVPYRHFIKAYGTPPEELEDEEEEMDDEERAKVVRHYLDVIAQVLKKSNIPVREMFKHDSSGLIYPEDFVEALKTMNLEEIPREHVILMIEALQYEETDEDNVCISIDELEEILVHYGVEPSQVENAKSSSRRSSNYSYDDQNHVKKISLLDSPDNYEYSEDSPEKQVKGSPGISENSPFASLTAAEMGKNSSNRSFQEPKRKFESASESEKGQEPKQECIDSEDNYESGSEEFEDESMIVKDEPKQEIEESYEGKSSQYSGSEFESDEKSSVSSAQSVSL